MSGQGSTKLTPGDGFTAGGTKIAKMPVPENADYGKPVEYTNNVVFEDTTVKVHVHKDLIVEGELVVHGKVTVRGYSQFEGPSARFRKDYTASKEKIDKHVYPQGRPESHTLEMEFKGDAYGYGEGLTFSSKDKRVVIKGNLMVDGNFVARGAVRFFEDVSLDGGAFFKNKPNVG